MEVREKSNKVQDLPARAFRVPQSEEPKSGGEMSEVPFDIRHEAGYLEIIYPELLKVRECGEVTEGGSAEPFWSELWRGVGVEADTEPLDERKQPKLIRFA